MPLDHYVSQVHLKNFYSPILKNRVYAIRKVDQAQFTPRSQDICRIPDGSTNPYLQDPREVENFLLKIEPNYNAALSSLRSDNIDEGAILVVAGFVAYVMSCSPAAMQILSYPLRDQVEHVPNVLDARKMLPTLDIDGEGPKTTSEMLREGNVDIQIDPKYPQGIAIDNILKLQTRIANCPWDLLRNGYSDSPYFTSDFPAAIEGTADPRILNRIVPLAPDLAIRIKFSLGSPDQTLYEFDHRRFRPRDISHSDVVNINTRIVQCAEEAVFFRDNASWVSRFVEKNSGYWIYPISIKRQIGTGTLFVWTQRTQVRPPNAFLGT